MRGYKAADVQEGDSERYIYISFVLSGPPSLGPREMREKPDQVIMFC